MKSESLDVLKAFTVVAREQSFTRAAALLEVTPSALSQTIRALEARIGLRLLARTTRSVSPTDAGERLLTGIAKRFEEIDAEVLALSSLRERPVGTIRITATEDSASAVLWPLIERFLPDHPEVNFEVTVDYGLRDIVADRYDAGVRLGDIVAKDMIAIPLSGKTRMIVVGAPNYFANHPVPRKPLDLEKHRCINFRMATHGQLYAWEFKKQGQEVNVRVDGPLVFNSLQLMLTATLGGAGLAYLPEGAVLTYLNDGTLCQALDDWCPLYPGYHLYYPSRRHHPPAFDRFVETIRKQLR
jgi:DNA-binding transcriptional LysR family regulator